jgi:hypothetical protein
MSVKDHVSGFLRDVAMILEECQIQCQAMAIEASTPTSYPLFPTFSLAKAKVNAPESPKKFASSPIYSPGDIAQHSAEWFDDQLVALASRTKRPFGHEFRKKLHHVFPSIIGRDMVNHISRLVARGRIKNLDAAIGESRASERPGQDEAFEAAEEKEPKPTE